MEDEEKKVEPDTMVEWYPGKRRKSVCYTRGVFAHTHAVKEYVKGYVKNERDEVKSTCKPQDEWCEAFLLSLDKLLNGITGNCLKGRNADGNYSIVPA